MKRIAQIISLAIVLATTAATLPANAKEVRSSGRGNVNSNHNSNQNKNVNKNTNVNVNQNKNVNIDVDVDHHGHGGGCCYHEFHPVAAVATAVITAAVIGSMVNTLPPSCTMVMVNGFAYQQCGSTWYQPQIAGSSTTYIVVNPPH